MTDTLPDNTGYVAAAYLVFVALVVIYLVIMAVKLSRFERQITELNEIAAGRQAPTQPDQAAREEAATR